MKAFDVEENNLLKKLEAVAESSERLCHYTSLESLLHILKNKTIILSKLSKLNDKAECINVKGLAGSFFSFSMTIEQEYVSMWKMYGKESGVKIRLDFSTKEFIKIVDKLNESPGNTINEVVIDNKGTIRNPDIKTCNLFGDTFNVDSIKFAAIAYYDKKNKCINLNNKELISGFNVKKYDKNLVGLIKSEEWSYERELRLLVNIPKKTRRNTVLLEITDELIKTFEIVTNPWISNEMFKLVEKAICDVAGFKIKCRKSTLNNKIC